MSDYQIETRRRSRSKTPFLRSSCDHENCEHAGEEGHSHQHHHHQKKKAPNVQTIVEETVEVTSSISPTKQTQKTKTSDYSSEDTSPESKSKKTSINISEEISQKSKQMSSSATNRANTTTTTTSTTVITKNKRTAGAAGAGGAATSTPKAIQNYLVDSFASQFTGGAGAETATQRFKEITQNALNTEFERSQRAAVAVALGGRGSNNSSINKSYSQILGNSNGDLSDHIAYMEYKRAGEYWNTTPKTDYTYSEHSSFRRELAPGIVAMPNMSRSGLKNHHDRINYMIERDPAQEEFIRRRYESSRYAQNRRDTEKLTYDSGDEVDYELNKYRKLQYNRYLQEKQESWYMRIITTIVTTITSAWTTLSGGGGGLATGYDSSSLYRTKYGQVERGFFGSIAHGISSSISRLFRYVYLLISSVLCFDTWLLQSSNADGKGRKRFLLLLLILLPLLLLGGLYYYLHPNESFPPRHFSEMTFTLPELPDVSEYFNEKQYVAIKEQTYNRLADFRDWTDDYILYLRTISSNILDEGRKIFQREDNFERV